MQMPTRRYRTSQLVRLLSDQEEFRASAIARYERFEKLYPKLIKASIVLSILVPVALVTVFALTPTVKVVLLTVWLCWVVAVFVFLVVLETLRFSFRRQMKLGNMAGDRLMKLVSSRARKGGKGGKGSGNASAGDKGGGHE